jgi:hypothetical protein
MPSRSPSTDAYPQDESSHKSTNYTVIWTDPNDVGGCLGKGIFEELLPEIVYTFISSLVITVVGGLIWAAIFGVDGVAPEALGAAGLFKLILELILKGVLKGFIANLWKRPMFWVWSNWHVIWSNRGKVDAAVGKQRDS